MTNHVNPTGLLTVSKNRLLGIMTETVGHAPSERGQIWMDGAPRDGYVHYVPATDSLEFHMPTEAGGREIVKLKSGSLLLLNSNEWETRNTSLLSFAPNEWFVLA